MVPKLAKKIVRTSTAYLLTAHDFHVNEVFFSDDEANATVKPQNRRWDIPCMKIKACVNVLATRTEVWPTAGSWV